MKYEELKKYAEDFGTDAALKFAADLTEHLSMRCRQLRAELEYDKRNIYLSPETVAIKEEKERKGNCPHHNQPGGCQLHNLQCGWPKCNQ